MPRLSEAETRKQLIDPALERAGWNLKNHALVGLEIPVEGYRTAAGDRLTDYCLYRQNGEVIAVVEAKRTSHDPRLAQQQAEFYVNEIARHQSFRPFAFLTNGTDIYFLNSGNAPKRLMYGFPTPSDLDRLLFLQQQAKPLNEIPIDNEITNRAYQHEAIRRVCETFDTGKRKALLVMATGTGKTRTAMSIIDIFLRANQARNILFVADRDALVIQAKRDGFEQFLPDEPCDRIYSHNINQTNRLYAVTLQTLSNCFEQFSPAFFDLIVFDEVHRSIFNKFNEVFQYFDARMIGLTATPAQFIHRDTFGVFECNDGKPTYLYTYEKAVEEGFLVDYTLYAAQTRFQRKGIHGIDLSEEDQNLLIDQGIDPDNIDYDGTQIEKDVSNTDTLRRQWEEIMEKCYYDRSGQLPGKTIIFAMTQAHASRLQDVFEEMYPQFPNLVRVITHKSEYRGQLIDKFKHEDMPRIAISVDMLDTGIDVPEVVNLVFMKPVHSRIKLEQMIGRGTRCNAACKHPDQLPGGVKQGFQIIDFWENDFTNFPEAAKAQDLPVLVALFNTRINLLETYLEEQEHPDCQQVIQDLREMVARIPQGSFSVRRVLPDIEQVFTDTFWRYLLSSRLEFLRLKVAPLLRLAPGVDVAAETFSHKIERLKLANRRGNDPQHLISLIVEDVARLPDFVVLDEVLYPLVQRCTPNALRQAPTGELGQIAAGLAPQMKYKRREENFIILDLPDQIDLSGYILLTKSNDQIYVKEYRRLVEERIMRIIANHPAVNAIAQGDPVDEKQLIALERTLQHDLAEGELEASPHNLRKAYGVKFDSFLDLLRMVLDIDAIPGYEQIVSAQFEQFVTSHNFNADQIRFMVAVKSVFIRKRQLVLADLYQAPLTNFGEDAVDRWFAPDQIQDLLIFTDQLKVK